MEVDQPQCCMCSYVGKNVDDMSQHIVLKHAKEANFEISCTFPGCIYKSKSYDAFKKHFKRSHKKQDMPELPAFSDMTDNPQTSLDITKTFAALFLEMEGKHKLSEKGLDDLSSALQDTFKRCSMVSQEEVMQGIEALGSAFKRRKFYEENKMLVEAKRAVFGFKQRAKGGLKVLEGMYVPFKEYLQMLLSVPEIADFVMNERPKSEHFITDYHEAELWNRHPIFSSRHPSLAIVLYFDEIDVTNALRNRSRTPKMGMFYFTLANIPVQFRSKLQNIHLLAEAPAAFLRKYGAKPLLHDFCSVVNKLRTSGETFSVKGVETLLRGDVLLMISDTPAGGWLTGMKESPSFSYKCCRICETTREEAKEKFRASEFLFRDMDVHEQRLQSLEYASLPNALRRKNSKEWGINSRSFLCAIEFDFLSCMPYDPMHVLLEGQFPYILALFLFRSIKVDKTFSLNWLNDQLLSYDYSYLDKGAKPEPIAMKDLDHELVRNTAAANLTLVYCLPHILGTIVPSDCPFYQHLILLIEIILLCTSPFITTDTIGELDVKIAAFLKQFQRLYPRAAIKPKAHQLVHIPIHMKMFGPGRTFWAMRWEGKHSFFKAVRLQNHRNVAFSLAKAHAIHMACQIHSVNGVNTNYVQGDNYCLNKSAISCEQLFDLLPFLVDCDAVRMLQNVSTVSEIRFEGHIYRRGVVLVHTWCEAEDSVILPRFGVIKELFYDDLVGYIVALQLFHTVGFCFQVNSYEIQERQETVLMNITDLQNKWPLPLNVHNDRQFVTNRYCHFGGICL